MLVFCPNLAVDHILEIGALQTGTVQHAKGGVLSAGGKGLNLARAARCLGFEAQVVGLVGGRTGALLRSLLATEQLQVLSPEFAYQTRIATILHDMDAAVTTVINEPGPTVSPSDWRQLTELVLSRLAGASALVCTGSLLPGVADDGYVDLVRAGRGLGVPVIIDASGPSLIRSAEAGPDIIKVNLDEAESATGRSRSAGERGAADLKNRACAAAGRLHDISAGPVVVTTSAGAALAERHQTAFLSAPAVKRRNEIGAGDAFIAGLAAALRDERGDLLLACRHAVAVASASVEDPQPGKLDASRADQLQTSVVIEICQ